MDDVITVPPPTSILTCAVVASVVTSRILPLMILRALSRMFVSLRSLAPAPRRDADDARPPRSACAGRRRLKAEAAEHGAALLTAQQIEEGLAERPLPGSGHDRARIDDRAVRVARRKEGFLHALGARRGVGGIDEASIDLAARHVVEHLAHVLSEHELRLQPIPETQ